MTPNRQHNEQLWRHCLAAVDREYLALDFRERAWIVERLRRIAVLQQQLNELFVAAGGPAACSRCLGACCERGKNHFTLVNLLAFLSAGQRPPVPDFRRTCPFLGDRGCVLDAARRPFNCVTFICEQVLDPLGSEGSGRFQRLEQELRSLYLAFDERYAGSSLRGLLIRAERLDGRPFLAPV
jgi:hypothetical protein